MVRLTRVSLGRGYEKSRGFEIVTARIVGAIGRTLRKFSRRSARMPRSEERGGRAARSEAEANSRLGYNSPAWKGRLLDYGDAWCRFFRGGRVQIAIRSVVGGPIVTDQELSEKESLRIILLDVETIEGKRSRRNGRDSDKANDTTMENVLWGHGGLVTGRNKGFPRCVSL